MVNSTTICNIKYLEKRKSKYNKHKGLDYMEKNIDIYNENEECTIKAKMFYKSEENSAKHFCIFCHGYCSGKGSNSIKVVANELLKYNIYSISFDFPGHVDSVQGVEKLTVKVCISYINSVINYIKEKYGKDTKISFFAISFGAYILLNKLIGDKSKYENIILRSPAINMKDIFIKCLLKEPFEEFRKNEKGRTGHDGKIEVPYTFYKELLNNDIIKTYHEKRKILILQGSLDDTAPIEETYKFIKDKPEIELIEFANLKHHMSVEEINLISRKLIEKLRL